MSECLLTVSRRHFNNEFIQNVIQTVTRSISRETVVSVWFWANTAVTFYPESKKNLTEGKIKSSFPAVPMIHTNATRAIIKLQHLMEQTSGLSIIISRREYDAFTGNTGPNGPCITGISIPLLGFTLPSSSVAETLSSTPHLLHQPGWMVRVMTVVCLWVAQTQRTSLPPPRQNSASVVGPSVHHCNICILPSMGALSSGPLETESGCL